MKLKDGMITDATNGDFVAVATGKASHSFNGLIRNNATSHFIFTQLMTDTTEEAVLQAVLEKYDVSEETARCDIRRIIAQLREQNLLDE